MQMSEKLFSLGVFAPGIRPPTVPPGTSRVRVTVMATHTRDDLDRALVAFARPNLTSPPCPGLNGALWSVRVNSIS